MLSNQQTTGDPDGKSRSIASRQTEIVSNQAKIMVSLMFVNEIRTLKSCAGVWALALALNAAAQMPVGFVVNNGPPQTGVVVGRAFRQPGHRVRIGNLHWIV